MILLIRKEMRLKKIFESAVKPFIASIIMALVLCYFSVSLSSSIVNTIGLVFIGIVIYFIAIIALRDTFIISSINKIKLIIKSKIGRKIK